MKLAGRTALVFGAGSSGPGWGNGKAAAVLYAREGARVVAVDRNEAAAEATRVLIAAESGTAIALAGDITSAADIDAVVARTLAEFGRIDVLHNNVGITDMGLLEDISEERWQRVLDINLTGVFLTCKAVVPVMLRQGGGAIVNISSVAAAAINRYPYFSYYASKAGLNHFTRALAVQYAMQGIRANVIMPGLMDTPLVREQIAGQHVPANNVEKILTLGKHRLVAPVAITRIREEIAAGKLANGIFLRFLRVALAIDRRRPELVDIAVLGEHPKLREWRGLVRD